MSITDELKNINTQADDGQKVRKTLEDMLILRFETLDLWVLLITSILSILAIISSGLLYEWIGNRHSPIEITHEAEKFISSVKSGDSTYAPQPVVASKRGKTYYLPWCPQAEKLKKENKIIYKNSTEAELAGYKPAKNCK